MSSIEKRIEKGSEASVNGVLIEPTRLQYLTRCHQLSVYGLLHHRVYHAVHHGVHNRMCHGVHNRMCHGLYPWHHGGCHAVSCSVKEWRCPMCVWKSHIHALPPLLLLLLLLRWLSLW